WTLTPTETQRPSATSTSTPTQTPTPVPKEIARLSGMKFDDLNGNGRRDPFEPGLPGWTIQLDLDSDGIVDGQAITDVDGHYEFIAAVGTNINLSRRPLSQSEGAVVGMNPTNPANVVVASNNSAAGLFEAMSNDGGMTWTNTVIADGTDSLNPA